MKVLTPLNWFICLYIGFILGLTKNLSVEQFKLMGNFFLSHYLHTYRKAIKSKDSVKGRGSRLVVFFRKGVLKDFKKCTGKDLCWNLFLIKVWVFTL